MTLSRKLLPRCAKEKSDNRGPCKLVAGWGTGHKGSGRCRKHRGNDGHVTHGLFAKHMQTALREKYEEALDDPRLTQIEEQIAYKSSLLSERNNTLKDCDNFKWTEVEALLKISESISRDIERWHKMKHGELHVVRIEKINVLIDLTVAAANEFIPNALDREKFLGRLKSGVFSNN